MDMFEQDQAFMRIVTDLRVQIDSGNLSEGNAIPSENALQQAYGLPRHRVRQALEELEETGYIERSQGRRSRVAPASARIHQPAGAGGKRTLALALPEFKASYSMDLLHGFMLETSRAGYQTVFYSLTMTPEKELEFLRTLRTSDFDGLAYYPAFSSPEATERLRDLKAREYPLVLIDRYTPDIDTDYVTSDNEALGYSLGRALCERGHTKIAYACVGSVFHDITSVADRYRGFLRALDEAEVAFDEAATVAVFDTHPDAEAYANSIRRVLALRDAPTAFQCVNDVFAQRVLKVLDESRYRVPEDIEVAIVDDDHFARDNNLPLIVAEQNGFEIGKRTARLLMARVEDPSRPHEHHFVPPETAPVVREGGAAATATM